MEKEFGLEKLKMSLRKMNADRRIFRTFAKFAENKTENVMFGDKN